MVNDTQRQKRKEWCNLHLNDNWRRTIFSDETSIWLFGDNTKFWYKGPRPHKLTVRHPGKLHVWGAIHMKKKIPLYIFKQNLNADLYCHILEWNMLGQAYESLGTNWVSQQDNDPKHTSKKAQKLLSDFCPKILQWPSSSPDLNPIENIWALLKSNAMAKNPKNLTELEEAILCAWDELSQETICNCIRSMNNRCKMCIDSNGFPIKY